MTDRETVSNIGEAGWPDEKPIPPRYWWLKRILVSLGILLVALRKEAVGVRSSPDGQYREGVLRTAAGRAAMLELLDPGDDPVARVELGAPSMMKIDQDGTLPTAW